MNTTSLSLSRRASSLLLLAALAASGAARADDNGGIFDAGSLKASDGEQVYQHICRGCHMADGKGAIGAGHYPAFAGSRAIASARYMASTVLYGRHDMPSFMQREEAGRRDVSLTDEQIADVVNYIRTHFGNHYADALTASEVAALKPRNE